MTRAPITATAALAAALVLVAPPSLAEIGGFTLFSFEGDGFDINTAHISTDRQDKLFINIEDCLTYYGGTATVEVTFDPFTAPSYSAGYSEPGGSCPTSADYSSATDRCDVLANGKSLGSATSLEFNNIDMNFLMGLDDEATSADEACKDVKGDAEIRLVLDFEDGATDPYLDDVLLIDVDLEAPVAPAIESVSGGDGRLSVSWTHSKIDDVAKFRVYYKDEAFTDLEGVTYTETASNTTSRDIESGLANGTTYYIRVVAVDEAENLSEPSVAETASPEETLDFWELYKSKGGTDEGGHECFIATAAYGTPMAGELDTLRGFRDQVLKKTSLGSSFVDFYYRWGRFPASWLHDKPFLRGVVRVGLVPLIWLAKLFLSFSFISALCLLLSGAFVVESARRRWVGHILRDVPPELALLKEHTR